MFSSRRADQVGIAGVVVVVCFLGAVGFLLVGVKKTKEPAGVVDQVGTALRNTATKIEQELSSVVKKIEESETPTKVGNKLKRSVESIGPKVDAA